MGLLLARGLSPWALIIAVVSMAATAGCGSRSHAPALPKAPAAGIGEAGRNVIRIGGLSSADIAAAAALTAYPPGRKTPNGWLFVRSDRWQEALLAAQFAAAPVSAAILALNRAFVPAATEDLVSRLRTRNLPRSRGLGAVVLGDVSRDVFGFLQQHGVQAAQLQAATASSLAAKLVPFRGGFAGAYSSEVVIVSSEDPAYALPAAAWSAYSGDTLAYVGRDLVPAATRALLLQRHKLRLETPTIYVAGPKQIVSNAALGELGRYGRVVRIAGSTPIANAIAFARYRDPQTGFGWGLRQGPSNISLVNAHDWGDALGALTLAGSGPEAPLLLTSQADALPAELVRYLQSLRGRRANQGVVFGSPRSVSSNELRQFDQLLDAHR
ncbi:MAG: cell wall-binding repeat-containing protein [Actinobacteria bacterium]|nr:MAG: cell wall-binding repeat-containing protein [Actinomycetota bacterium]